MVNAGWCANDDNLEEAKRLSHDYVIAGLGRNRTSGVSWIIEQGDAALDVVERMRQDATPEELDHYDKLDELLRDHGGYLVVAMANGRRTWAEVSRCGECGGTLVDHRCVDCGTRHGEGMRPASPADERDV